MNYVNFKNLKEHLDQLRSEGCKVLYFDSEKEIVGKYPTGCLLIDHPDLRIVETFMQVEELRELWKEQTPEATDLLGLFGDFDHFYKTMMRFFQKNQDPTLGFLLERLMLFRDNPLYNACGIDMEIPRDGRLGAKGLTEMEVCILVATTLICLTRMGKPFDRIYLWENQFLGNKFLDIPKVANWSTAHGISIFQLSQVVAEKPEKNLLAKTRDITYNFLTGRR